MSQINAVIPNALKDWIPVSMMHTHDDILCRWIYTGTTRYCDPFFDETIARYVSLPLNARRFKSVSQARMLGDLAAHIDSVYPTAIIFHVSRCGSTLISQALGYSPANISVSEVPVFDELLRLQLKGLPVNDAELDEMFTGAVKFYGARKAGEESHFFIKTDCWHLLFHDRIRRLYPDVPFIIIYRNPSEVLESNRRHRGMQSICELVEPALFGFDSGVPEALIHPDNYIVPVLEKLYSGIIDIVATDKNVLLLNYNEGFNTMMQKLLTFTGITPSPAELAIIEERGRFSAKSPSEKFVEQNTGDDIHDQANLLELYGRIVGHVSAGV